MLGEGGGGKARVYYPQTQRHTDTGHPGPPFGATFPGTPGWVRDEGSGINAVLWPLQDNVTDFHVGWDDGPEQKHRDPH